MKKKELKRTIEELESERDFLWDTIRLARDAHKRLADRVAKLERENEVLRADAEAWREMALAVRPPTAPPIVRHRMATPGEYDWGDLP